MSSNVAHPNPWNSSEKCRAFWHYEKNSLFEPSCKFLCSEIGSSFQCLLWYRSGLKVLSTSCCDWVTVTETNWEQSRFSESQHHRVAEMFVFWFCSLVSDCTLMRGMGMEQNTGHSLWKGRKCNSRMFTVHFLQPSCLLSGLGLCWVFLPHAVFPLPNVCLSWHTK